MRVTPSQAPLESRYGRLSPQKPYTQTSNSPFRLALCLFTERHGRHRTCRREPGDPDSHDAPSPSPAETLEWKLRTGDTVGIGMKLGIPQPPFALPLPPGSGFCPCVPLRRLRWSCAGTGTVCRPAAGEACEGSGYSVLDVVIASHRLMHTRSPCRRVHSTVSTSPDVWTCPCLPCTPFQASAPCPCPYESPISSLIDSSALYVRAKALERR